MPLRLSLSPARRSKRGWRPHRGGSLALHTWAVLFAAIFSRIAGIAALTVERARALAHSCRLPCHAACDAGRPIPCARLDLLSTRLPRRRVFGCSAPDEIRHHTNCFVEPPSAGRAKAEWRQTAGVAGQRTPATLTASEGGGARIRADEVRGEAARIAVEKASSEVRALSLDGSHFQGDWGGGATERNRTRARRGSLRVIVGARGGHDQAVCGYGRMDMPTVWQISRLALVQKSAVERRVAQLRSAGLAPALQKVAFRPLPEAALEDHLPQTVRRWPKGFRSGAAVADACRGPRRESLSRCRWPAQKEQHRRHASTPRLLRFCGAGGGLDGRNREKERERQRDGERASERARFARARTPLGAWTA